MVVARWIRVHGPKRHGGAGISPTDHEDELDLVLDSCCSGFRHSDRSPFLLVPPVQNRIQNT